MSDVKGIEISNLFGLEEPTTKLIECISAGIGKVYEPIHVKRMAKAKKKEIEIIGEAITENINLPTKYQDGNVLVDTTSADELIKRTGNRLLFTEMRKQQNIDAIISQTYDKLEKEENVTSEPVDRDWLFNFFDIVGNISDEKIQEIWSSILAGEIKFPHTYTLRTLNTLKNISTYEANLFEKIIPFIFYEHENPFLYNNIEILKEYGLTFSELLILEDCGLINLNGTISIDFKGGKNIIYSDKHLLCICGKAKIGVYTITESGKQIINLIKGTIPSNDDYFLKIFKKIKENYSQIEINVYKIKKHDKNEIEYDETIDLLSSIK